jgi:hypothetical protein
MDCVIWRVKLKVIHRRKNLFCYVAHICNLVQEFNGLVSKRVDREISPFYLLIIGSTPPTISLIFVLVPI